MTRIRGSKLSSDGILSVLLGAVSACGATTPAPVAPTTTESHEVARLPDAVVLDPPPSIPDPVIRAKAEGVVSLREPAGREAVIKLVLAFLDAWENDSLEGLVALSAPDASAIEGTEHAHGALIEGWRQRLRTHDYGHLAGLEVLRPDRVQIWAWDELGTAETPARPPGMVPSEIFVRAPLEVTRVAGEKVFGDALVMVLRQTEGKLRIVLYGEVDGR